LRTFHKQQKSTHNKFYLINYRINSSKLRVISDQGDQIGILSKDEALKKAQEANLDLVLIAPNANPPVAKIIDFKKFLYQENKKVKEAKKGIKKSITKDINLGLFIAQADLERLVNKAKEFIANGNQVRVNLTLKGRQITKKNMGFELINKFIDLIGEVNISKEPRLEGRVIRVVISKKKK